MKVLGSTPLHSTLNYLNYNPNSNHCGFHSCYKTNLIWVCSLYFNTIVNVKCQNILLETALTLVIMASTCLYVKPLYLAMWSACQKPITEEGWDPVSKWLLCGKSSLTWRQTFCRLFYLASIPHADIKERLLSLELAFSSHFPLSLQLPVLNLVARTSIS